MLALTSKKQLDLLTKVIEQPNEGSVEISELLFEKWRDKNLAEKMRSSIFSFTQEEFLKWLSNIDIKKIALTEKDTFDGLYAISEKGGWRVYVQERAVGSTIVEKVSLDEAKLAAAINSLNFTTGGYLVKLFNREGNW